MWKIAYAIVAVSFLMAGSAAGQDFQAGLKAYYARNYEAALKEWLPLAEQGHAKARFNIGIMYRDGQGVERNLEKTVELFLKAANQGYFKAQNNLAFLYRDGNGVIRDYARAAEWFLKSAEQDDPVAQSNLGNLYRAGNGVPQDDNKAVEWWLKAARQGDAVAQLHLGYMYSTGKGVLQDDMAALQWWQKAAKAGNAEARSYLDHMNERASQWLDQGHPENALEIWGYLANNAHVGAQYSLGIAYWRGAVGPKNLPLAVKWLRAAAIGKMPAAYMVLAEMYAKGEGVRRNPAATYALVTLAEDTGSTRAARIEGLMEARLPPGEMAEARRIAKAGIGAVLKWADERPNRPNITLAEAMANLTDEKFRELVNASIRASSRLMAQTLIVHAPRPLLAFNVVWIEENAHRMAPGMLYAFAIRMLEHDPEEAGFWWRVAGLRFRFDFALCKDRSVGARQYNFDHQFRSAVRQRGLADLRSSPETVLAALDWIEKSPNHEFSLLEHCGSGLGGMRVAMEQQGMANKSPWEDTGRQTTLPGYVGKVEMIEPPKIVDEVKWIKPKEDHDRIVAELKAKIRAQLNEAIKEKTGK